MIVKKLLRKNTKKPRKLQLLKNIIYKNFQPNVNMATLYSLTEDKSKAMEIREYNAALLIV
jgi:hypothetical protein